MILVGAAAQRQGLMIAEQLRTRLPQLRLITHLQDGSFKNQFKKADKAGAHYALILGDDECTAGTISVKNMRAALPQQHYHLDDLCQLLQQLTDNDKD